MNFPNTRMRRLRKTPAIRELVRENTLSMNDLIQPAFIVPGSGVRKEISSLSGQFQMSIDVAAEQFESWYKAGIKSVLLFAIPESKDEQGSSAWDEKGIIQEMIREAKRRVPELYIITDLCFCEYTSHGHCGILTESGELDNDATLEIIQRQTLSHAQAGADMIAPSGMIDGMVGAMRIALDESGFSDLPIMSYSAKYASAFYGPFREAVDSAPQHGDRKSYQMDPANLREAIRETALDVAEGADIIMVKPALAYLDVALSLKQEFDLPLAGYNVSGEYAMIKAAAEKGWIDGERVMLESLYSMKRAGMDLIITYFADELSKRESLSLI